MFFIMHIILFLQILMPLFMQLCLYFFIRFLHFIHTVYHGIEKAVSGIHFTVCQKQLLLILYQDYFNLPQHCLYFLPLPHGHGSFGYTLSSVRFFGAFCRLSSLLVPVTFATSSRSTFCSTFTWKR